MTYPNITLSFEEEYGMAHEFIQHLKEDHEKQRELGKRLIEATDPAQREELRKKMYEETYPHMIGEEASIFTFMQNSADEEARQGAMEAVQEHHIGKIVLRELMDLSLDSEVFKAKAKVLDELNRHHMDEEEEEHFPWLEGNRSADQLQKLFDRYEKAEEEQK
jgi:iron-sulfur cluster repair protein YtfE (RIC family)